MPLISYESFEFVYLDGGYWDGLNEGPNLASEERAMTRVLHPDASVHCTYCSSRMSFEESDLSEFAQTSIHHCRRCGWWQVRSFSTDASEADLVYSNAYMCNASAKKYNVDDKGAPIAALHKHLRRHINDLAHINPKRLEVLVTSVLEDYFGKNNTKHIGGNKDNGIDVLCCQTNSENFLVQVKRREDIEKNEAFQVVDAILGACVRYADHNELSISDVEALIISTAAGYTPRAIETVRSAKNNLNLKITLFDKNDLHTLLMLSPPQPYFPWHSAEDLIAEKLGLR